MMRPFKEIREGAHLYIIPTTGKSLAKSYFFNTECQECLFWMGHYLMGWLNYYKLRHDLWPRLQRRYLEYLEHIGRKELKLEIIYDDGTRKRFTSLEDFLEESLL